MSFDESIIADTAPALSKPTITLRSSGEQFTCHEEEDCLLELLERHQVAVEYQCRQGYCGACRARLLKGRVAYQQQPLAAIQPGEVLLCCCLPLIDIELEIY